MAEILKFSKLNPIAFHRSTDGCYWINSHPTHEQTQEFYNPWQQGDKFRFQIEIDTMYYSMNQIYITLRQCGTGLFIANFNTDNSVWNTGAGAYKLVLTYSLTLPAIVGDYYIEIKIKQALTSMFHKYYSEPINIKASQTGTVMFTYSSYGIIKDTWFINTAGLELLYYFRTYGGIQTKDRMPGCESNVYVDQSHTFDTLSSQEFDTFKLTIGNNYGTPYPYISLINRIIGSNRTLKIDGVSVNKTGNTTLEQVEHADKYTRGIWKVELAEESLTADIYEAPRPVVIGGEVSSGDELILQSTDLNSDGDYVIVQIGCLLAIAIDSNNETYPLNVEHVSGDNYKVNLSRIPTPITLIPLYT